MNEKMITRIIIRNFKAFQYAEINLTELNLFTGMNGMGKSSFIQALLLLRQSQRELFTKGLSLKGEYVELGKGRDVHCINADSDFIGIGFEIDAKQEHGYSFNVVKDSDLLPIKIHSDEQSKWIETVKSNLFSENRMLSVMSNLFSNNFQYLNAARIEPHVFFSANLSKVQQERSLGKRGEHTPLFIALNRSEPIALTTVQHPKAINNTLLANIDAWLSEITPGTRLDSTYLNDIDIVKLTYRFEQGEDFTPEFSSVNVGFGFTYVLPVITAILAARPGDLVIIENPESHLHPQGQAKMGELLALAANGGVQLIIESHSDHLLNGLRVAVKKKLIEPEKVSIFFFERDIENDEHTTRIVQPIIDENGRLDQHPKGFFDEYAKQLDALIR
jgi:predicted ATPase